MTIYLEHLRRRAVPWTGVSGEQIQANLCRHGRASAVGLAGRLEKADMMTPERLLGMWSLAATAIFDNDHLASRTPEGYLV